jgi:hypothetical protein
MLGFECGSPSKSIKWPNRGKDVIRLLLLSGPGIVPCAAIASRQIALAEPGLRRAEIDGIEEIGDESINAKNS